MIKPSPNKKIGNDSGKTNTTLFLAVGGILLLIVKTLAIIISTPQQRNKNLLDKVKTCFFPTN